MGSDRRLFLLIATAGAVSAITPPNFVVLFVDDMGINQVAIDHDRFGKELYGYTGDNGTIVTPHVARLAAEGLVFQTWYSSFHVCSPSRSSMMTGRLPVRTGVGVACGKGPVCRGSGGNQVFTSEAIGGLQPNETTTAEALRQVGYVSMMIGKWHLGQREKYLPTNRGFDHYLGIPFSQDMGASAWRPQVHEPYQPTPLPLLNNTQVMEQPCDLGSVTKKYAAAAKDFVSSASAPFYLYASFNHIHAPSSAGAEFCGKSKQGAVGDSVMETDWAIGEIMDAIRARDATDGSNTLVIFTSDNGAPTGRDARGNEPLRGGKGSVWEGGFREPGIAWGHGVQPGLTQSIASTMDVHVTLLTQAGARVPQDRVIDGIDLTSVFEGKSNAGHECYAFYAVPNSHEPEDGLAAVRCGAFKAYWKTTGAAPPAGHKGGVQNPPLMFNLVEDHSESIPLDPNSTQYAEAMVKIMKWRKEHLATVQWVTHQTALGSNPEYAICGAPGSKPINCSLTPENWKPASVCKTDACLERQDLTAQCANHLCPGSKCPHVPEDNVVGCFVDHQGGQCDLPHVVTGHCPGASIARDTSMDRELCNAHCSGFKYFGLQMGGTGCFCGNAYGSFGEDKAADACSKPCLGNSSETCGGSNRNLVIRVQEHKDSKEHSSWILL